MKFRQNKSERDPTPGPGAYKNVKPSLTAPVYYYHYYSHLLNIHFKKNIQVMVMKEFQDQVHMHHYLLKLELHHIQCLVNIIIR